MFLMLYISHLEIVFQETTLKVLHQVSSLLIVDPLPLKNTMLELYSLNMLAGFFISHLIFLLNVKKPLEPSIILNYLLPITTDLLNVTTPIMISLPPKIFSVAASTKTTYYILWSECSSSKWHCWRAYTHHYRVCQNYAYSRATLALCHLPSVDLHNCTSGPSGLSPEEISLVSKVVLDYLIFILFHVQYLF